MSPATFIPSLSLSTTRYSKPSVSRRVSSFTRRAIATQQCVPKRRSVKVTVEASDKKSEPQPPKKEEQTFFGLRIRTNGDVLKFGVAATVIPFGIKELLQIAGVPDLFAGQLTTGFVCVFALLAWVSTYVFRVGTKQMTYAQQLKDYEDQVIQKRYEELTAEEVAALNDELKEES